MNKIKNAKEAKELQKASRERIIKDSIALALEQIAREASMGQEETELICILGTEYEIKKELEVLGFKCKKLNENGKYVKIIIWW